MPFSRRRIKVISDGATGRNRTRYVRPTVAEERQRPMEDNDGDAGLGNAADGTGGLSPDPTNLNLPTEEGHLRQDDIMDEDNASTTDNGFENTESRQKTYREIKAKDIANWSAMRTQFLQAAIVNEAPPASLTCCLRCGVDFPCSNGSPRFYRCRDCGPCYFACIDCLIDEHFLRPHHIPEQWNGDYYTNFQMHDFNRPVEIPEMIHTCSSKYSRCVKVVDMKGRLQECVISFCKCEPEVITLFKIGLWPSSSKKPSTAYSMELLKSMKSLMLECHVSVLGFTNSMRWRNGLTKSQASSLYRLLVNESFEEYRYFSYKFETMETMCPGIDDGGDCMLCPKENGKVVLMLDGTFGCVRKESSGMSIEQPKHGDRFFLNQGLVDDFVAKHGKDSKGLRLDCSNFKAGTDRLRSKVQNSKLDVTGIFGCSCKHEIPGCFLSMKHGERLGYPVYLLKEFMDSYKSADNVTFGVLYDISCLLFKHIKKNKLYAMFQRCLFATPDWHAYGHVASCQINFAVRFLPGFGLTDGEGVERLWSYLRQFTAITKEMTPSHRVDLLTDGLLHFAQRKNANMEYSLIERAEKAERVLHSSQDELVALQTSSTETFAEEDIRQWHETEKNVLSLRQSAKANDHDWTYAYIEKLLTLSNARNLWQSCTSVAQINQVQQHIKTIEKETKVIERQNGVLNRWNQHSKSYKDALRRFEDRKKCGLLIKARSDAIDRIFHISLKKKYSSGQTIPKRIEVMIKGSTKKLNATVENYNAGSFSSASNIPNVVSFVDLKDPESSIYDCLNEEVQSQSMVPASVRRKAVSMLFLKKRAIQEKKDVTDESKRMIVFLENRLMKIQQRCEEYSCESNNTNSHLWKTGASAILRRYSCSLESRITSCREMLSKYVPDLPSCSKRLRIDHKDKETLFRRQDDETENVYDHQLASLDVEDIETYYSDAEETDDES